MRQQPRASPCCLLLGSRLPRACLGSDDLVLWSPVAFCHAGGFRGTSMGPGLEKNLAVRAGRAEEPLVRICKVVSQFC